MDSQLLVKCPQCAAQMKQTGTVQGSICYHCEFCGAAKMIKQGEDEANAVYFLKRSELLSRVRKGILNWQGTNWDLLYGDVADFLGSYEEAREDAYFKMATVACLTEGYNTLNKEKYKRCKAIFKVTEKCYKLEMRALKEARKEVEEKRLSEYEEFRNMYLQCRSEYRNTKIYWKVIQFVFRRALVRF